MNSRSSVPDYSNIDVDSEFSVVRSAVERIRERRRAATPPDSNTGGNLPFQVATVDTLTFTLALPALSDDPLVLTFQDDDAVCHAVTLAFLEPLGFAVGTPTGRRLNGYQESAPIVCPAVDPDSNGKANFGYCAWGGNRNKAGQDTLCVYLTGQGCESINLLPGRPWHRLELAILEHSAKITRVDIAYDDLEGRHGGVSSAVGWYKAGKFQGARGGIAPSVCQHGDWIHGHSRTLEVGRRENGKMVRVYEKGHQLGAMDSPWVRYELELRSRDRVIPAVALTNPTAILAGSSPAMEFLFSVDPVPVRTVVKRRLRVTMDHLQHYASVAYGRLINAMQGIGMAPVEILDALRVDGLPSRLFVPPALVVPAVSPPSSH